ncbi:MAG TPA: hypothetical protein PLQ45_10490, partial [Anaerohalosphaeraceae bacterium]|nr:hypothetical protein [Anaerohalosphaeraceae bacterium]
MAAKGFSNRQKSVSGRRLVLILAMVVLLALILWRQGFYKPQQERKKIREPEITPVSINPIPEKPVAANGQLTQITEPISQPPIEPPVISRKPGYELYEKGV